MSENNNEAQTPQLNLEQIKAAIESDKTLQTELVSLSLQTEAGKTFLNNHLEQKTKEIAANATGKAYQSIDDALKSLGFEKQQGEKTSEFSARVIKELQEKAASASTSEEATEEAKKMIEAIKAQSQTEKKTLLQQIETLKTQNHQNAIKNDLNSVSLVYDAAMPDTVREAFKGQVYQELMQYAKTKDGKVVYYKPNGEPYLDKLLNPATAEDILKIKLEPILQKSKAGGSAQTTKEGTIENGSVVIDMSNIKTQTAFFSAFEKIAKAQGIAKGTKEYYTKYNEAREHYKINSLPEA